MSISKSQIVSKLKSRGLVCYPLDNSNFYIPAKDPKTALQQVYGILVTYGAKPLVKSKNSTIGAVEIGSYKIFTTPFKYRPKKPSNLPSSIKSVKNRMAFSLMLKDTIVGTIRPLTIVFDGGKKVKFTNVEDTRFLGDGIADFVLQSGTRLHKTTILTPDGSYRENITGKYLERAYEALEKVTMDGVIDAEMNGDRMTLNSLIAFPADSQSIRELIFQDLNNGIGVVGDFKESDFNYDGKTNTLSVKCQRVFASATDLKTEDKPYFVIVNNDKGQIGELKGLQLDLVPQRSLPRQITIVDI